VGTSENCDKTKLLPVIAVPITNDASNADLTVTEVIKVVLPNSLGREGMAAVAKTQDSPSKEGWVTVTTKKEASHLAIMIQLQERLCHGI
jgi:hypothetical protein